MSPLGDRRYSRHGWRRFWLTLLVFGLVALYSTGNPPNHFINEAPATLVRPVVLFSGAIGRNFRDVASVYLENAEASQKLNLAHEELNRLKTELIELDRLKRQVNMLREQLEFSDKRKDLDLVPAEIISKANSGFSRGWTIKIDPAAAKSSIQRGSPVVASNGLIGQIIAIDGQVAEVMLLSDTKSAVDVRFSKSGVEGIAIGSGEQSGYGLRLKYLSQDKAVETGERLVTSGRDGKFPSDLSVGVITAVVRKGTARQDHIQIGPPVPLDQLKYVFVVLGQSGISADGSSYSEKP
jgi:rod shape-determining protein MreC